MLKNLLKTAFRYITNKFGYSLLILIPTLLTVSYQSWKAALANPVDSLYEN